MAPALRFLIAIRHESESVQIIKRSFGDWLIRLNANKIARSSAVYIEHTEGRCSFREYFPIRAAHPAAFSDLEPSVYKNTWLSYISCRLLNLIWNMVGSISCLIPILRSSRTIGSSIVHIGMFGSWWVVMNYNLMLLSFSRLVVPYVGIADGFAANLAVYLGWYIVLCVGWFGMDFNLRAYWREMKWWCFRPLLCTLFRLNWAKQTPGIMRRN